jgi:hypothetical protein
MNQFPVGRSHVGSHHEARSPIAMDAVEQPMLLHPYYHDPANHLRFGEDGTIAAAPGDAAAMGTASIDIYNLKRGDLVSTRIEYQTLAWNDVLNAMRNETPVSQAMAKYESGASPYSLACVQYVKQKFFRCRVDFMDGI